MLSALRTTVVVSLILLAVAAGGFVHAQRVQAPVIEAQYRSTLVTPSPSAAPTAAPTEAPAPVVEATAVQAPTLRPVVVVPATPRAASAVRVCPVDGWSYHTWTVRHDTPSYNGAVASAARLGTIPAGTFVQACQRPDGWLAVTGYGWVRSSDV